MSRLKATFQDPKTQHSILFGHIHLFITKIYVSVHTYSQCPCSTPTGFPLFIWFYVQKICPKRPKLPAQSRFTMSVYIQNSMSGCEYTSPFWTLTETLITIHLLIVKT